MEFYTTKKVGQLVFSPSTEKWCSQNPLYPHCILRCSRTLQLALKRGFHLGFLWLEIEHFLEWFNLHVHCHLILPMSWSLWFQSQGSSSPLLFGNNGILLPVPATAASMCCFLIKETDGIPRRRQPLFLFGVVYKQTSPLSIARLFGWD